MRSPALAPALAAALTLACGGGGGVGGFTVTELLAFDAGSSYDFGSVAVGSSSTAVLTLRNLTGQPCTVWAFGPLQAQFSYPGGAFPGTGGDCSLLEPTATCGIAVTFAPTAAGPASGSLEVECAGYAGTSTDPTPIAFLQLLGTGVP